MVVKTAEEFLDEDPGIAIYNLKENDPNLYRFIKENLLAFAEAHRKEGLRQASEKAKKSFVMHSHGQGGYYVVNKDSILNAYSKKNIR